MQCSHLAATDMGRKLGAVPLWGGELGPHQMARTEAYLHANFIFIRPTVWPQCTNVTDRQTGQDRQTDNGLIA